MKTVLFATQEVKKPSDTPDSWFYRYRWGEWFWWFTQRKEGEIYTVSVDSDTRHYFDVQVDDRTNTQLFYPCYYGISFPGTRLTLKNADEFIKECKLGKDLLEHLNYFFENSEHKKLYEKYHKGELPL